jgi:hypothetical protein
LYGGSLRHDRGDAGRLFVTATGGLIAPYQGVAQEAKIVVIEVNARGAAIEFLEETE